MLTLKSGFIYGPRCKALDIQSSESVPLASWRCADQLLGSFSEQNEIFSVHFTLGEVSTSAFRDNDAPSFSF